MDILKLKAKEAEIAKEIKALKNDTEKTSGIADGIINIDDYYRADYKILWILNEPYKDNGGWSLPETICKMKTWSEQANSGRPTYKKMIYASYGILNDFIKKEFIPKIEIDSVYQTIHQIAYINIKKLPNIISSNSNPKEIALAYKLNKNLLLKQIELYNPDIVIGGSTLKYFYKDLGMDKESTAKINMGNKQCYFNSKRIYIDAYHPSQLKLTEKVYVDEIISTVENWVNNKKKTTN